MSAFDWTGLTLNPQEAQSASELVFKKTFVSPSLESIHGVMTDVQMDKYIPILGRYGLLGKADPGSCNNNDVTDTIPTTQKIWEPKMASFRIVHCQDQLPDRLKFWKKSLQALNTWSEVDGEMMTFIEDSAIDGVQKAIIRIGEFGDKTASPVGDVTGNELLTAGVDKTYFNLINGMWKQVFLDQAGAAKIHRYSITENAAASKTLQFTLAADRALRAMRDMYDNLAPEAFEGTTLKFQMTRSLFNNWQAFLEDESLSFTLSQAEQKGGTDGWSYRGIPIVVRSDWDRIIKSYHDLGTTYYLPHRIILADINNIPIGTSDSESLTSFKSHFDETTEKHYIKCAFKLDAKILLEEEVSVAY